MDGWGGRGATWCHKAQVERAVQGVSRPQEPTLRGWTVSLTFPAPKQRGLGRGHAPRLARARPQGPERSRGLCRGLGRLLP